MILLKRPLFIATVTASFLILIVAAHATQQQRPIQQSTPPQRPGRIVNSLGIEVSQNQNKTFFMQAATSPKTISAIIKVPPVTVKEAKGASKNSVSAIRLEPKLENDKVRVTVYAIYGDIEGITNCVDMDALKKVKVDTYLARVDEEVFVKKLRKFNVKMEKDPFTFRVVSKSIFAPMPSEPGGAGGCGCMKCNRVNCCPNSGYCVECECVTVCCSP